MPTLPSRSHCVCVCDFLSDKLLVALTQFCVVSCFGSRSHQTHNNFWALISPQDTCGHAPAHLSHIWQACVWRARVPSSWLAPASLRLADALGQRQRSSWQIRPAWPVFDRRTRFWFQEIHHGGAGLSGSRRLSKDSRLALQGSLQGQRPGIQFFLL